MVEETTLPATVQAAKADEEEAVNSPPSTHRSSWPTSHRAQRNRLASSASTMPNESNSDDETTKLKKKKNREAAQRCRMRKKQRYEELKKEKLDLSSKQTTMNYKVMQLQKLQDELQRQLDEHSKSKNCRLYSSNCGQGSSGSRLTVNIDPNITRGLQSGGHHLPSVGSIFRSAHVPRRNSGHVTATATTTAAATYCNTLQRSPIMADNQPIVSNVVEMQETQTLTEENLPNFPLLMENKSRDVTSLDKSNMDGEVNESISGRLVLQSTQVLNNQGIAGLCEITDTQNIPTTQTLNNNPGLNHKCRMTQDMQFLSVNSVSMGGLCDNTQVATVSYFENNKNMESEITDIKSEQSAILTMGETMSDNTSEQESSQTMSEPELDVVTDIDSLQNLSSEGISDFEQSNGVFGHDYFRFGHNHNNMSDSSFGLNFNLS